MKYCPNCKSPSQDDANVCSFCGASIADVQSMSAATVQTPAETPAPAPEKGNKKLVIIIVAVVALIAVVGGVLAFVFLSDKDDDGEKEKDKVSISGESEDASESGADESEKETETVTKEEADTTAESTDAVTEDAETTTEDGSSEEDEPSVPSGSNQYDMIRSGQFYLSGTSVDAYGNVSPMAIGFSDGYTVMSATDTGLGMSLGLIISDDGIIMISDENQSYLYISASMMNMMGVGAEEFVGSMEMDEFSNMPALDEADSVTEEKLDGKKCTVYIFGNEDGTEERIYMDGDKLLRIGDYDSATGEFMAGMNVDTVKSSIPADKKTAPSGYKKYEGLQIMQFMEDIGMSM